MGHSTEVPNATDCPKACGHTCALVEAVCPHPIPGICKQALAACNQVCNAVCACGQKCEPDSLAERAKCDAKAKASGLPVLAAACVAEETAFFSKCKAECEMKVATGVAQQAMKAATGAAQKAIKDA